MSLKKIVILFFGFYILAIVQTTFLVHFNFFPGRNFAVWGLNLISISVILVNFIEEPRNHLGIFAAIWGGFFWDIFSESPIGFHILSLFLLAVLIKIILKNYVRFPVSKRL